MESIVSMATSTVLSYTCLTAMGLPKAVSHMWLFNICLNSAALTGSFRLSPGSRPIFAFSTKLNYGASPALSLRDSNIEPTVPVHL